MTNVGNRMVQTGLFHDTEIDELTESIISTELIVIGKNPEELSHLVSNFYKPSSEDTIIWNDEDIGIEWPLNPVEISVKDLKGKIFKKTKSIKEKT